MYVLTILSFLMIWEWVRNPVVAFSVEMEYPVSPWIYSFITEDWYLSMTLQIAMVLLYCDAPFINEETPFEFIRCGRRRWFAGQILYIFVCALLYQIFIAALCAFSMLPHMEWTTDWGSLIYTLAEEASVDGIQFAVYYFVLTMYEPWQAMLLMLSLTWLVTSVYGMMIFAINTLLPKACGVIMGCILTMVSVFALNFSGPGLLFFSPGSWMTLSLIDVSGLSGTPSLGYIYTVGAGLLALFMGLAYIRYRRKAIDVVIDQ
ncbi:MAG: hypothetical protein Q4D04_02100 [Clostridia bacterium]|nr:hypothetical protein [Clostridia bacterium]